MDPLPALPDTLDDFDLLLLPLGRLADESYDIEWVLLDLDLDDLLKMVVSISLDVQVCWAPPPHPSPGTVGTGFKIDTVGVGGEVSGTIDVAVGGSANSPSPGAMGAGVSLSGLLMAGVGDMVLLVPKVGVPPDVGIIVDVSSEGGVSGTTGGSVSGVLAVGIGVGTGVTGSGSEVVASPPDGQQGLSTPSATASFNVCSHISESPSIVSNNAIISPHVMGSPAPNGA